VMEHESFENVPIAELMNQNTEHQGRPRGAPTWTRSTSMWCRCSSRRRLALTMFLTPDREPFTVERIIPR
jgi:uncharacterized protein YyaL (SSP411 family)